jgi:4,5-DOPA dioxygenase extradiol
MHQKGSGFDWALEAGLKMKSFLLDDNHHVLINYRQRGTSFALSIPTPEYCLPLLYVVALKGKKGRISLFDEKTIAGSINMTSVKIAV